MTPLRVLPLEPEDAFVDRLRGAVRCARGLARRGVQRFGLSRHGNAYRHLLVEADAVHNFLGEQDILDAVRRRFASHKAGDLLRTLTNTTASTPFCFNLFVPLQRDLVLASALMSTWLGKAVKIAHVEIEFTPNHCNVPGFDARGDESLGDQSGSTGTDADVAIFYSDDLGKRGVALVETKYIEDGFSLCSSYKEKARIRATCDAPDFYAQLIASHLGARPVKPDCGYLRYANWSLTASSRVLDGAAVGAASACPFRGSGQQIWRNLLLAERVATARGLDELHFWVLSPAENTFLWDENGRDVEAEFRRVLAPLGRRAFRRLDLRRDVVEPLRGLVRGENVAWLTRLEERYVPSGRMTM